MKAGLLMSSALIAVVELPQAAAAGEGIELRLDGFLATYLSAGWIETGSNDPADYNASGLYSYGKTFFTGQYTADNGLMFGAYYKFKDVPFKDDKRFVWVEGDFGKLLAGNMNSAALEMHVSAPSVGMPINEGWVTSFIPPNPDSTVIYRRPILATYIDYGSKESQVTYYTPRLHGFQLGVSYAPAVANNGDGQTFPAEADRETQYFNGVSAAVSYHGTLGPVRVAADLGWRRATVPSSFADLGFENYESISAGLQLGYRGFTLGGSYANEIKGQTSDGTVSTEGQAFDVGLSYAAGPWSFGAIYYRGTAEGEVAVAGDDSLQAAQLGIGYQLGPGIQWNSNVLWALWDTESGNANEGVVFLSGLTLNF